MFKLLLFVFMTVILLSGCNYQTLGFDNPKAKPVNQQALVGSTNPMDNWYFQTQGSSYHGKRPTSGGFSSGSPNGGK